MFQLPLHPAKPLIAISLVEKNATALLARANLIKKANVSDLIEWRLDYFEKFPANYPAIYLKLREIISPLPLIVTLRTRGQGGYFDGDPTAELQTIIQTSQPDFIDLEFNNPNHTDLIKYAQQHKLQVIISDHQLENTPTRAQLTQKFQQLAQTSADVLKLATTIRFAADNLRLLQVTQQAQVFNRPLITMGMGTLGQITRLYGSLFGSCVTFCAFPKASAPGQLTPAILRKVWPADKN